MRRLVLPFDAYQLSLSEYYTVSAAQDRLIRSCMGNLGHEWAPVDRPSNADDSKNRRRYGVIETTVAERFGYHAPEKLLNPYQVAQREEQREAALSPDARKVALDPTHGCSIKSYRRLLRGADADYRRLNKLDAKDFKSAQTAPVMREALKSWSTCMRGKSYDYATPDEAIEDPRWWKDPRASASEKEIATAKTDVQCKRRTKLIRTWFATEKALEKKTLRQHEQYFHELAAAKQRQLRAAHAILADHGGAGQ
ncbi:hypothetical protein [Streptomyces sp. WAC01526]|uniref:hypothetical protein n=1 Tax=Streptomyces sp. WAC01526 TaxID=2588709 RepID=UPI0011DF0700|nr:hypothetical protein [Streptomyces sp. WAC01526]